ncbi:Hypothetical protein HVR_LOCUS973 [uncultured virus]|nr:Hypothetical protein HVR_LOCUS973 [uncultured virus]
MFDKIMNIEINSWRCYGCNILYLGEKGLTALFFQVDAIEDDKMLVSNYYEQRFVKYPETLSEEKQKVTPSINAPYCRTCIDAMPGITSTFEPEQKYTFKQEGKKCWNLDNVKAYKRDCGKCVNCQEKITLESIFNVGHKWKSHFFLIWSPYLASRVFPDPLNPQIFISDTPSSLYKDENKPSHVCDNCFGNDINWKLKEGPIECPMCNKRYQRWIFHWARIPVKEGCNCQCHMRPQLMDDKEIIKDGHIDAEEYEWITDKRPEHFNPRKPFCIYCLKRLVETSYLRCSWESCSDSDEELKFNIIH